jgi:two-component system, OmpR family, phosphate regulon response regulator PhoB
MHAPALHTRSRILLVEDEPSLAHLLCYNFEAVGYSVDWVADGALALRRLMADPPHAAILDVSLPGLSGLEILRRARAGGLAASVPIIIVSGQTGIEERSYAFSLGVEAYLTKPFSLVELMEALALTLRRRAKPDHSGPPATP